MRVEILPALVRFPPDDCMHMAVLAFDCVRYGYPAAEKLMWQWLFRWAGMPV